MTSGRFAYPKKGTWCGKNWLGSGMINTRTMALLKQPRAFYDVDGKIGKWDCWCGPAVSKLVAVSHLPFYIDTGACENGPQPAWRRRPGKHWEQTEGTSPQMVYRDPGTSDSPQRQLPRMVPRIYQQKVRKSTLRRGHRCFFEAILSVTTALLLSLLRKTLGVSCWWGYLTLKNKGLLLASVPQRTFNIRET